MRCTGAAKILILTKIPELIKRCECSQVSTVHVCYGALLNLVGGLN